MDDLTLALGQTRDRLAPPPNGLDRLRHRRERRVRRNKVVAAVVALIVASGGSVLAYRALSGALPEALNAGQDVIAFTLTLDPRSDPVGEWHLTHSIHEIPALGGDPEEITPEVADYLHAAWSPDGQTLAVVRFSQAGERIDEAIYTIDVETGEQTRLISTGEPIPISVLDLGWSPDGTKIAYTYARYQQEGTEADDEIGLFVMNADGSDPERLSPRDVRVPSFSWSPSGSEIAYTREGIAGDGANITSDIFVLDLDTGESRVLTQDGTARDPAWSPRGDAIAFVRGSQDAPAGDVWLISANGTTQWALTETGASEGRPTWSPDASEIAFTRVGDEGFADCSLIVASAVTGSERRLADETLGGCPDDPAWRPDPARLPDPDSPDAIVFDESYTLTNLTVEYPAPYVNPVTGEESADPTKALVSFDWAWTGAVSPGEAECVFTLMDANGGAIVSETPEFAAYRRQGRSTTSLTVGPADPTPVAATATCGQGTRPTGDYVFSDLRVDPTTDPPKLVGQARWATIRPPLLGSCIASFRRADGSTAEYPFSLSVGEGQFAVLLSDQLRDATPLGVECQPGISGAS